MNSVRHATSPPQTAQPHRNRCRISAWPHSAPPNGGAAWSAGCEFGHGGGQLHHRISPKRATNIPTTSNNRRRTPLHTAAAPLLTSSQLGYKGEGAKVGAAVLGLGDGNQHTQHAKSVLKVSKISAFISTNNRRRTPPHTAAAPLLPTISPPGYKGEGAKAGAGVVGLGDDNQHKQHAKSALKISKICAFFTTSIRRRTPPHTAAAPLPTISQLGYKERRGESGCDSGGLGRRQPAQTARQERAENL